jgi:hypothetical protein
VIRAGKTFTVLVATAALTLGYIATASAETFYRWTDDRGNPVHSDRPPPKGIDYEVVSTDTSLIRPVEAESGAVPKKIQPTPSNDFEPVETKEVMIEKNPEYCARGKENLKVIDETPRIRMRNEQGEMEIISPETRAIQRQQALDTIANHCE